MFKFFKKLKCKHTYIHIRDIQGDEINHLGARSVWKCLNCGKTEYRSSLGKTYKTLGDIR